jgi:hypothetical protein
VVTFVKWLDVELSRLVSHIHSVSPSRMLFNSDQLTDAFHWVPWDRRWTRGRC